MLFISSLFFLGAALRPALAEENEKASDNAAEQAFPGEPVERSKTPSSSPTSPPKPPAPTAKDEPPRASAPPSPENFKWYRQNLSLSAPALSSTEKRRHEEALQGLRESKRGNWPAPSSSIACPSGFGASWTEVFFGMSVQNRPRFRTKANGTGYLGFGLGNPREWVGLEVSIGIYGLVPPGERGGMNLKLHRNIGHGMGVAFGRDSVFTWGGADAKPTHYLALSKTFNLKDSIFSPFSQLSVHFGIGDGAYRTEEMVFTDTPGLGWFGAAGLRVLAPLGVIVNWSGQDLFAGISVTPSERFPVSITLAAQDLTRKAGDGVRYLISVSYTESIYRLPLFN